MSLQTNIAATLTLLSQHCVFLYKPVHVCTKLMFNFSILNFHCSLYKYINKKITKQFNKCFIYTTPML